METLRNCLPSELFWFYGVSVSRIGRHGVSRARVGLPVGSVSRASGFSAGSQPTLRNLSGRRVVLLISRLSGNSQETHSEPERAYVLAPARIPKWLAHVLAPARIPNFACMCLASANSQFRVYVPSERGAPTARIPKIKERAYPRARIAYLCWQVKCYSDKCFLVNELANVAIVCNDLLTAQKPSCWSATPLVD